MNPAVDTLDRMLVERGRSTTALGISIFLRGLPDHRDVITFLERRRLEEDKDPYPGIFLVQVLCWSGDQAKAELVVKDMIHRFSGTTYEDLLAKIQEGTPEKRLVRSHFVSYPNSTMQNIGFFEHHVEDRITGETSTLITKMTTQEYSGTELDFYELARMHEDVLGGIAPRVIDVTAAPDSPLCFLTMEKVAGTELVVQDMSDAEVDGFVRTYTALGRIDHRRVARRFAEVAFEIGHSHAYLVAAMQKVHEPEHFRRINDWLLDSIRSRGYSTTVVGMITDMVDRLAGHNFHERIDPTTHYQLLHGDLHRFNVLQNGPAFKIIDWGKCMVGPKGIDLAVLFRRFPFDRMIDILERNGIWASYAPVNRILFAYALVVVSVMIDLKNIKEEPDEQLFRPATDFIARTLTT